MQGDYAKRPVMSMVIKALEGGAKDAHKYIDYNFVPPQKLCERRINVN